MSKEKVYELGRVSPEKMVEDFLASEEAEQIQSLLDDGWKVGGIIDKDTTDEEIEAIANYMAEEMIKQTGGVAE